MPGSVLIIDADEEFAGRLKSTLEAHGANVQTTGDGRAGLDMARADIPDAIIVCVELPRMSGYSICAKLKKDANLKSVTLVITSAEATQETFEHHKKLKNRAEEYLRKPFDPTTLAEVLSRHIQLEAPQDGGVIAAPADVVVDEPQAAPVIDDSDAFSEDDHFHFDDVPDIPVDPSVVVEPRDSESSVDQNSGLVESYEEDEVMTTVGAVPSAGNEVLFKEIEQLRVELEAEREAHAQTVRDREDALANERAAVAQLQSMSAGSPSQISASRDLLAIKKELHDRDKQLLKLKEEVQQKERDLLTQRDREMEFEGRLVQQQEDLEENERIRVDLESQLQAAHEQSAEHTAAAAAAKEDYEATIAELRVEVERLKNDIDSLTETVADRDGDITSMKSTNQALNGEVTRLNNEVSATLAESSTLREQLQAAQTMSNQLDGELVEQRNMTDNARNALEATQASLEETEEQAARAFERIRRDGETKTKVRQALDIALRLLTEPDEAPVEDGAAPPEEVRQ